MSSKFKLTPDPTFVAPVNIHVPGGTPHPVKFTFKYRTPDEYREFIESIRTVDDGVVWIRGMATGWDLPEEFSDENISEFVNSRFGVTEVVVRGYATGLMGAREKN